MEGAIFNLCILHVGSWCLQEGQGRNQCFCNLEVTQCQVRQGEGDAEG